MWIFPWSIRKSWWLLSWNTGQCCSFPASQRSSASVTPSRVGSVQRLLWTRIATNWLMKTRLLSSKYGNKIEMHCSIVFVGVPEAWFSPHNAVHQLLKQMDMAMLCGYLANTYPTVREAWVPLVPLFRGWGAETFWNWFCWWPATEGQTCAKSRLGLLRISLGLSKKA